MATSPRQGSFLLQGTFGERGNFECVVPVPTFPPNFTTQSLGGLAHYFRDNNVDGLPWLGPFPFSIGAASGASMIQSNFKIHDNDHGNLELVAVQGGALNFYWRENGSPFLWRGPFTIDSGVTGTPALLQGTFGENGNFEVVVPRTGGGLAHYWRNNDADGLPWSAPLLFGAGSYLGVAMIESNFQTYDSDDHGNLELVAVRDGAIEFYFRENDAPLTWFGPFLIASSTGGNRWFGAPAMIQSSFGDKGSFDVVVPVRLVNRELHLFHFWRDNDDPAQPWYGPEDIGVIGFDEGLGPVHVSLIESDFQSDDDVDHGNFEVVACYAGRMYFFYRDNHQPFTWHGPFTTALNAFNGSRCIRLHAKVLQAPNIAINTMVTNMQTVFNAAGINVQLATTENLTLPALNSLDVGNCGSQPTAEINQLFANRNFAGANDIVVYFVQALTPGLLNGCATFPPGLPGATVAQTASPWTLAHEIGHVLGLMHPDDGGPPFLTDRLMTGGSTNNITNPPPDLVPTETTRMRQNGTTPPC